MWMNYSRETFLNFNILSTTLFFKSIKGIIKLVFVSSKYKGRIDI